MQYNIHSKFISTPITEIVAEAVDACSALGFGMAGQPLSEYVLQTTFLKMTGASEQKMKCLCWEMATRNFKYRYDYLSSNKNYGECSTYKAKNDVYKDLLGEIQDIDPSFKPDSVFDDKQKIIDDTKEQLYKILDNSVVGIWVRRGLLLSKTNSPLDFVRGDQLKLDDKNIFESSLAEYYNSIVYLHRNRCAHNLKSYQNNLPSLKTLEKNSYQFENYFYRYLILSLLDTIFIRLYTKYIACLDESPE